MDLEQTLKVAYENFDQVPADVRAIFKYGSRIRAARYYAQQKNILGWGSIVLPHIFYLPYCQELHGYLVHIRGLEFTCTKAPRNHAKTSVGDVLIPLFQALEEPQDFQHYLTIQGSQDKALALNRTIKNEIEGNDLIGELYGDMIGQRWTDQQFELANGVAFSAVSTGTSVRGIIYNGRRPDYLMPDDIYDEEDINNPESTLKKNVWFWSTLYSARAKTKRWSIHVTGTAINEYDLMTKMEKDSRTDDGAEIICKTFKAVKDFDKKIVLWPELHSASGKDPFVSVMLDFKRMGTHIAMRELQNEPRDETTAIIKRGWLYKPDGRNWEYDPAELRRRLREPGASIRLGSVRFGSDPSIGKKNDSDPTGFAKVIETIDGEGSEFWIEWVEDALLTLRDRKDSLVRHARECDAEFQVSEIRIEAIGGFDDYASYVINETNLPIKRVEWVPDKITNLENRSHYFENGKVHISNRIPAENIDSLVHQLTTNYPEHDDKRDGVLLCMDLEPETWEKFMR